MKKMMKLFHDTKQIGEIEFLGVNGSDMLGFLTLTPEGDNLKEMFAFLTSKETRNLEPPYSDSLLKEGWFVEDHEGIMRKIICCPDVFDNFTKVTWRWSRE